MNHCVQTILAIVARGVSDRRSILQLGYNLGRLSEITGRGREPFWDRWKEPVYRWDLVEIRNLAQELLTEFGQAGEEPQRGSGAPLL